MNIKEKISIDEFDGKRFQIRLIEPKSDKKAVLTHYLHNIHNGVSKHYKKDALKVLKEYVEYKEQDENNNFGFLLSSRAFCSNLFVRNEQKGF